VQAAADGIRGLGVLPSPRPPHSNRDRGESDDRRCQVVVVCICEEEEEEDMMREAR